MIFIDASYYLSLLNSQDSNHKKAAEIGLRHKDEVYVTSQAVLGEVLTVGSQRIDRKLTIKFIEEILKSQTRVILETKEFIDEAFLIFKEVESKNISWVDCYSLSIMKKLKIKEALSFDKHFSCFLESGQDGNASRQTRQARLTCR